MVFTRKGCFGSSGRRISGVLITRPIPGKVPDFLKDRPFLFLDYKIVNQTTDDSHH